tara:strand:+ start:3666 stop:4076 length:411 start_codon:yes stop_codon:yes gene_type:complete
MKTKIFTTVVMLGFMSTSAIAETVQDHYKMVITQKPYNVEVCRQVTTSGDKTGDTLKGAIIGGIIGNNVTKNVDNGGAVGALLGGMLGHNNSKATGGTRTQCNIETRYQEETREVYSHSTVTFSVDGKSYTLKFNK